MGTEEEREEEVCGLLPMDPIMRAWPLYFLRSTRVIRLKQTPREKEKQRAKTLHAKRGFTQRCELPFKKTM